MASVAQLRSHIRSVNNTKQITSAMQLVSASKMRRTAEQSLSMHPYHKYISDLLAHVVDQDEIKKYPLLAKREIKTRLLIVITSDTGLVGSYNSNILKTYLEELKSDRSHGIKTQTIAIGRKAIRLVTRLGENVIGTYEGMSNNSTSVERNAIISTIINKYLASEVDAVDIIYTKYHSAVNQEVDVYKLLPAGQFHDAKNESDEKLSYVFEPSKDAVFEALVQRTIEIQVAQALFDSIASEHSTRMMAMKNATDNAEELSEDLKLAMNKERQAAITNELSDINNGANAVE